MAMTKIEKFLDAIDVLMTPTCWPLRWRRAFIFTLPVSGPVWVAFVILVAICLVVAWAVLGIASWLVEMGME